MNYDKSSLLAGEKVMHIVSISLSKQADDLCKLSVFLTHNGSLDQVFTVANQDEVAHLQTEFAKLIR